MRPNLPAVHETTIHVRWGELDPYHHVNHATYLSYLEHARVAALESIGWGMDRIAETGHQVVVVEVDVRFRLPAGGGDELVVQTSIADLRGASSTWRQRIVRGEDTIVEAEVTAACTDLTGQAGPDPGTVPGGPERPARRRLTGRSGRVLASAAMRYLSASRSAGRRRGARRVRG